MLHMDGLDPIFPLHPNSDAAAHH
ncbi:hypothetical protein SAM23877_7608 [Streptomyces ambofaciens ATCC 23877]|uniref:Uncharacterized protein n=1 Tax=Streptomyces ambofaciens (strain ATCC 23877 / 3486 / DSM 40053 / JCM 4204 / NBRC 12836 / NRRL B-2516) TaxID=278992 RepID=A0A0K2B5U4_STRA7|nr:hypothetical protein SAM23877_0064 [Streptomyces ambofaciens ATCC 23877]AKZ60649.1 hypothetical protein SAM23877_7608 [Streptomyces ambofaciens ATCC 23877]